MNDGHILPKCWQLTYRCGLESKFEFSNFTDFSRAFFSDIFIAKETEILFKFYSSQE